MEKIRHETYPSLLRSMVEKCANDIRSRESKKGIDTLILGEAMTLERLSYQPRYFAAVYNAVADRFDESFANVDFNALPFSSAETIRESFLALLWQDYFKTEIDAIISAEPTFAIQVMETIVDPGKGSQNADSILEIVAERYKPGSTRPHTETPSLPVTGEERLKYLRAKGLSNKGVELLLDVLEKAPKSARPISGSESLTNSNDK
ncbi:MAG: hypothetical protein ACKVQW_14795 [Pyrinomonadaceae bacterium]